MEELCSNTAREEGRGENSRCTEDRKVKFCPDREVRWRVGRGDAGQSRGCGLGLGSQQLGAPAHQLSSSLQIKEVVW